MVVTSGVPSFWSYLRRLPRQLLLGLLRAIGLVGIRAEKRPGMYWARDGLGRWELRVPARSLEERPPA